MYPFHGFGQPLMNPTTQMNVSGVYVQNQSLMNATAVPIFPQQVVMPLHAGVHLAQQTELLRQQQQANLIAQQQNFLSQQRQFSQSLHHQQSRPMVSLADQLHFQVQQAQFANLPVSEPPGPPLPVEEVQPAPPPPPPPLANAAGLEWLNELKEPGLLYRIWDLDELDERCQRYGDMVRQWQATAPGTVENLHLSVEMDEVLNKYLEVADKQKASITRMRGYVASKEKVEPEPEHLPMPDAGESWNGSALDGRDPSTSYDSGGFYSAGVGGDFYDAAYERQYLPSYDEYSYDRPQYEDQGYASRSEVDRDRPLDSQSHLDGYRDRDYARRERRPAEPTSRERSPVPLIPRRNSPSPLRRSSDRSSRHHRGRRDEDRERRRDRDRNEDRREMNRIPSLFDNGVIRPRLRSRSPHRSPYDSPSHYDFGSHSGSFDHVPRFPIHTKSVLTPPPPPAKIETVSVSDLISTPGRDVRPPRIVIIFRGLPGSGKTYVAKLIRDSEVENGGTTPRMLCLDDYFMVENEVTVKDPITGRRKKEHRMEYEWDEALAPSYKKQLLKAFKKNVADGLFSFIIADAVNQKVADFEEIWSTAKQNGFQVYVAEMSVEPHVCAARNVHGFDQAHVDKVLTGWETTPLNYIRLDVTPLIQDAAIEEVDMDDGTNEKQKETEEEDVQQESEPHTSKWDLLDAETKLDKLDKLDSLRLRHSESEDHGETREDHDLLFEEYAHRISSTVKGKKRVRWADLEEEKKVEREKAIGFVVGQTDWSRLTGDYDTSKHLNRTKYI